MLQIQKAELVHRDKSQVGCNAYKALIYEKFIFYKIKYILN